MTEPLTLTIQATPNPNALKLVLNRVVTTQGKTYRDAASADVVWARDLLEIAGIRQIFALNDFVSVTKTPEATWEFLVPEVERVLRAAFTS